MKTTLLFLLCLAVSVPGYSAVITVNLGGTGDYTTIQAAVDAAEDGDVIIVADGIYTGEGNRNIDFLQKTITVRSENGPTHCIVDCWNLPYEEVGFFVNNNSSYPGRSVLEGFTIRNGYTTMDTSAVFALGSAVTCAGTVEVRNCIFSGNYARHSSTVVGLTGGDFIVKNCTFYDNVSMNSASSILFKACYGSQMNIWNAISWCNTEPDIEVSAFSKCGAGALKAHFSILQANWYQGYMEDVELNNCIVEDPLFADPANRDFHLKSQQGRWDAFNALWVKDDVTSPGVDLGDPDDDYGSEPWPHGKRINAGAYGNTAEASLSVVSCGTPADVTGDDRVNYEDFSVFAGHWQTAQKPVRSDFDRNGSVGLPDLLTLAESWLTLHIDPTLSMAATIEVDEPFSVSFSDMPGNAGDWLGVCPKGASIEPWSSAMLQWLYTDGTETGTAGITEGVVVFDGLTAGEYEARLFFDNGYAIKDHFLFRVE